MWSYRFTIVVAIFLQLTALHGVKADLKGDLFAAIREDDPTKIQAALDGGAELDEQNKAVGYQTPLVNAILTGKVEAVKFLLDKGADYTIPEIDKYTVFHAAGFQGRAEIVRILGAHTDENGATLLKDTLLMSKHRDGYYPMHRACWGREQRHTDTVQAFLDLGVPYDLKADNGQTCMKMTKNKATDAIILETAAAASIEKSIKKDMTENNDEL